MLNFYKLKVFATVAKHGSFSRAAEHLYLTQSAISQHIQSLEAHLGTKLFDRGRRGVTLTEAGETLLEYGNQILWLAAEAENALTDVAKMAEGQLTIGATTTAASYLLPTWVRQFHQSFPQLKISLKTDNTNNILKQLETEEIDLGFVEGEWVERDNIAHTPLQDSELYVVVGPNHPWWEKKSISVKSLDKQLFISYPQGHQAREWEEELFDAHQVSPMIIAEFDGPEAIKRAVMEGMEAAILPCCVVREERERGGIHIVEMEETSMRRAVELLWNDALPMAPTARAFIETLTQQFPQLQDTVLQTA